nr:hypothetical protein [Halarchaeum acidiphilum]
MSASHASSATIEDDRSGVARSAATTAVGLSVLTMLLAVANVLNWITTDASVASVALSTLYGVALAVAGVVTVAVGLLSASAVIDANANDTSGVLSGLPVGLLALSVVGLVASQTLGYGVAIWAPAALVCAVAAFLFGSLAREDLTATLPWGGFALFVAAVLLAGVITPSWTWDPRHLASRSPGPSPFPVWRSPPVSRPRGPPRRPRRDSALAGGRPARTSSSVRTPCSCSRSSCSSSPSSSRRERATRSAGSTSVRVSPSTSPS